MKIGFYIEEMNYRGVVNSIFEYANNNQKILKNKSYIFYNDSALNNKREVILEFKKKFKVFGAKDFTEIIKINNYIKLDYIYFQRQGVKEKMIPGIKNIIHAVFPQNIFQYHGFRYAFISSWLSRICSNNKYPFVPLTISLPKTKDNMRSELNIPSDAKVFGCHGGETSFDLIFVQNAIKEILSKNKNIYFIFLNIKKFFSHKRIIFIKGSFDKIKKVKFINSCNAMLHARSLGESFGLSCSEFLLKNKPIFTYGFCKQRAHFEICKKNVITYYCYPDLINKILSFNNQKKYNSGDLQIKFSKTRITKIFYRTFLRNNENNKIPSVNLIDYIIIFFYSVQKNYYYMRHKIYTTFYKLTCPKI
jgi:hypothetical protein